MSKIKLFLLRIKKNDSLLNRSNRLIKANNNKLYSNRKNTKHFLKSLIVNSKSFIGIFPFMGILFSLCLIKFNFFDFVNLPQFHFKPIKEGIATALLDTRLSNIISITSVSLTIIGFIMTNLSKRNKESYNILFDMSYLYPIIYYTFSTSILLIFFSTFRSFFDEWEIYNIAIFAMVCITFEFIFIAFLFSRIKHFTDPDFIYKYSKENIVRYANRVIYNEKLHIESKKILEKCLSKFGKSVYSLYGSKFKNKLLITSQTEQIVKDVDLKMIENCLANVKHNETKDQIEFISFGINQPIIQEIGFNYACLSDRVFQHSTIQRSLDEFIYKGKPKLHNRKLREIIDSLHDKVSQSIRTNDQETLKQNLEVYDTLFKLYFENFK